MSIISMRFTSITVSMGCAALCFIFQLVSAAPVRAARPRYKQLLLSRDEAVTFALEHNKALQVYSYDKALAEADLLGARLYTNPTASMVANLPIKRGLLPLAVNATAALTFSLADLWQRPFRVRVAERTVTVAYTELRQKVLDTVVATQKAYDELLYAQAQYNALADVKNKKFSLEKLEARKNLVLARIKLYEQLSLVYASDLSLILTSRLTDLPVIPPLKELISCALVYNPELERIRAIIEQSREAIRYEKSRVLRDFNVGVAFAQDFTGARGIGPEVDLKVPLFDQNNAQRARAEITLQKAYVTYDQELVKLKNEITQLFVTFNYFAHAHVYYEREIDKQKNKSSQDTQQKFLENSLALKTTYSALERAIGKKLCC